MNYLLILFILTALLSKSLLWLLLILLFNIAYFIIFKINFSNLLNIIEKLSPFCIMLFISYFLIGLIKHSENIIYIYLENALFIVLKILIIISTNLIIKEKFNFTNKLGRFFKAYSEIEAILFEILDQYPRKIDKIINIDKIIVNFIIITIKRRNYGYN